MIKINSADCIDGGFTFEECKYVCEALDKKCIDAIEISGGTPSSKTNETPVRTNITAETSSYFKAYADEIARIVNAPVMLVGGNRDPRKLEEVLQTTRIEYISLCRPLIRERSLPARWRVGDFCAPGMNASSVVKVHYGLGSGNR
jgi:2,4-dienoyl-CoA reductase-like NADH-dependent reductase (Old Yellow Enzyme family)